ncbi:MULTISPECIES: OB-fold-containig protein [Acinetobacter]|jgi:hypothetical protein|uniref:DUF1449 family protein n=1 Tax=Acinetobacter chengduensis TaxID=2420890 RepID=A0ABX9TYJ3_9GAMM|nr:MULTISPECIES: OB-fold-containig protein [Acinetobacter]MBI1452494.1 DUF1449 family protein [Acinetobacter sp. FL51]RKG44743.1 DUF1449 family protein [Acinetobacter sp. WCHAc060007]RLL23506.1 DUF1449 family protein [Acinetobacter chengduensis]
MPNFFTEIDLIPFHLSLIAVVLLGVAETIGFYLHLRPSMLLKKISPKQLDDLPILNVKFSKMLIMFFLLMNFSLAGYFLQLCIYAQELAFFPWYYLALPALIIAIFFTVFMIHCLDQVIPSKYQRPNVNLLGRLATISSGNARPGFSAQARVRDEFGQLHYVQVEPEFGELEFQSQIILIRLKRSHYVAKKICEANQLFKLDLDT